MFSFPLDKWFSHSISSRPRVCGQQELIGLGCGVRNCLRSCTVGVDVPPGQGLICRAAAYPQGEKRREAPWGLAAHFCPAPAFLRQLALVTSQPGHSLASSHSPGLGTLAAVVKEGPSPSCKTGGPSLAGPHPCYCGCTWVPSGSQPQV